jgi:hypothetical protein
MGETLVDLIKFILKNAREMAEEDLEVYLTRERNARFVCAHYILTLNI